LPIVGIDLAARRTEIHRGAKPASAGYRGQVASIRRGTKARWNPRGRLRAAGPQVGAANRRDRLYLRARISGQWTRDRGRTRDSELRIRLARSESHNRDLRQP